MTTFRLILHSLFYYWRTNLAVLLGVVAGTAVIGGALIVGDSVRGSLRQMTYDRLGDIDHVITGPRFFRQQLADDLENNPEFRKRFDAAAPALVLTGGLEHHAAANGDSTDSNAAATESSRRVGQVNIYGIDERTWKLIGHGDVPLPQPPGPQSPGEIVLNRRVAEQLDVAPGESVSLRIELPAAIPRDSLLGNRKDVATRIDLTVKAVLPDDTNAARLSLQPNQQFPLNAFVSLPFLQERIGLKGETIRETVWLGGKDRRVKRTTTPPRVNTIFFRAKDRADAESQAAGQAAEDLTGLTKGALTLEDLYLRVAKHQQGYRNRAYLALESEQQVLAQDYGHAGIAAAKQLHLETSPVLVYLANEFLDDSRKNLSRYSVIAGVDFSTLKEPPFGPFEYIDKPPSFPLGKRDIIINEWLAEDLKVKVGDSIHVKYHIVGAHIVDETTGRLPEEEITFTVRGITRLDGTPADDRGFTPEVRGITNVRTFEEWNKPFEMKPVTQRDKLYWDRYRAWFRTRFKVYESMAPSVGVTLPTTLQEKHRATPKAFVSLETAQDLWRSRYGELTSVRVAPVPGKTLDESQQVYGNAVLQELSSQQTGMVVRPVKYEGLQAASGTTDFAGLFLAFSFFLILSATILIGMLFRLGIERRGSNVGLLGAVGFSPRRLRWLFLGEGLLVVVLGGLLGSVAAWGYASVMVYGLKVWWIGAIGTKYLFVYVTPMSLAIGFISSVLVAAIAIWWALRYFRKLSNRELLAGATEVQKSADAQRKRGRRSRWIAISCGIIGGLLLAAALAGLVPAQEAFGGFSWQVVAFFVVGVALLVGGLALLAWWLDSDKSAAVQGHGLVGGARLGMRNAARHRQRSVMTVALIASATFVIVAVAAGHRNPAVEQPDKSTGNGGFTLLARSSVPLLHDLNTTAGRKELQKIADQQQQSEVAESRPLIDFTEAINNAKNQADRAAQDAEDAEKAGNAQVAESRREEAKKFRKRVEMYQRKQGLLDEMTVVSFRVKPGEEASCLNIYQTRVPTILGAPQAMIDRGGFKFVGANTENPWTLLNEPQESHEGVPVVPAFGDMNTLQYSLHKAVGGYVPVPNKENPKFLLKIVGMFDGSVYQGVLLISEPNFRRLFPERAGYEYFLIDVPYRNEDQWRGDTQELQTVLETGLAAYDFDAEPVAKRIADFLAVQNTYLSTFQTLGGLGLLLGTLGLATVMLRNVLERRAELALLRAVGFRNSDLSWLVVVENALLMVWGLFVGTAAALLAMGPHLTTIGANVPWKDVVVILAGVFAVGMLASIMAVWEAVRTPIVATLRSE